MHYFEKERYDKIVEGIEAFFYDLSEQIILTNQKNTFLGLFSN